MQVLTHRPGSEQFDEAIRGYVLASRINDIWAHRDSKRHRDYLEYCRADREYCRDRLAGAPPIDPAAEYRESNLRLHFVKRALEGYEKKHGVTLARGRIYLRERFPLAAAPDAVEHWQGTNVEDDLIGITVHWRKTVDTYRDAVRAGITTSMYLHAIAMMAVTRLPNWIHINYFESAELAMRKMHEHEVEFSKGRADDLMDSMIMFARRVRQQEAA